MYTAATAAAEVTQTSGDARCQSCTASTTSCKRCIATHAPCAAATACYKTAIPIAIADTT